VESGAKCRRLALSRTRLAQRFLERTGVTPKRFARIVRFYRALSLLGRSENIAVTALLAATRYPNSASVAEP
jgi:AraC-like DNA-binding protein